MALSKDKVMLQVSITKELDEVLTALVNDSRRDGHNLTKSQLVESSLRLFINSCIKRHQSKKEEN